MHIERTIQSAFIKASSFFPVVLLIGPRQVGKRLYINTEKPKINSIPVGYL